MLAQLTDHSGGECVLPNAVVRIRRNQDGWKELSARRPGRQEVRWTWRELKNSSSDATASTAYPTDFMSPLIASRIGLLSMIEISGFAFGTRPPAPDVRRRDSGFARRRLTGSAASLIFKFYRNLLRFTGSQWRAM